MSVSVVIPAYNAERYVADAVESALAQTRPPLEIIVVDDGSTDGTRQAIEDLHCPLIRYVYQENSGPAEARNRGVQTAAAEFIAFLDADDLWLPTKLERQVPLFADPDVGVVYCRDVNVDARDRRQPGGRPAPRRGDVLPALVYGTLMAPSTAVIRRRVLTEHHLLFPTGRYFHEDWEFWFLLAQVTMFDYVDEVLVHVRRHNQNMTRDFEAVFRSSTLTRDRVVAHVMEAGRYLPAEQRRLIVASRKGQSLHLLRYGHCLLNVGRTAEARRAIMQAISLDFWNLHNYWGLIKLCLTALRRPPAQNPQGTNNS